MGFPDFKLSSAKITHKTGIDGAVLGLNSEDKVKHSLNNIRERFRKVLLSKETEGFYVQIL
jgi:acyl-CoA synthetase (NDP forming)